MPTQLFQACLLQGLLAALSGSAPLCRPAAALSAYRQTSYRPFKFAAAFQACRSFPFSGSYLFCNPPLFQVPLFHRREGINGWVTRQSSPARHPGAWFGAGGLPTQTRSPHVPRQGFFFLFESSSLPQQFLNAFGAVEPETA